MRQTAAGAAHDREALDRVRAQEAEVRLQVGNVIILDPLRCESPGDMPPLLTSPPQKIHTMMQALRSEVAALQAEVERARGEAAAAEALRREEEARHASECAELRGAAAAAAAAAEQATDRLARATEEHAVAAVGAARRAEAERAAAAAAAAEAQRALEAELAGLAPRLATAEQQLAGSRRLQDMLTVQHEQQLAELQVGGEMGGGGASSLLVLVEGGLMSDLRVGCRRGLLTASTWTQPQGPSPKGPPRAAEQGRGRAACTEGGGEG